MNPYIIYLVIATTSYLIGIFSGVLINRFFNKQISKFENNTIVLIVVSFIWALSMVVDILSPAYETSPLVHGLMGAIVGFFYKPSFFKQDGTKN